MIRRNGRLAWATVLCAVALGCGDVSDNEALFAGSPSGGGRDGGTFTGVGLPPPDAGSSAEAGGWTPSPGEGTGKGKKGKGANPAGTNAEPGTSPQSPNGTDVSSGWQEGIVGSPEPGAGAGQVEGTPPSGQAEQPGATGGTSDPGSTSQPGAAPPDGEQGQPAPAADEEQNSGEGGKGKKGDKKDKHKDKGEAKGEDGGKGNGHKGEGEKKGKKDGEHSMIVASQRWPVCV